MTDRTETIVEADAGGWLIVWATDEGRVIESGTAYYNRPYKSRATAERVVIRGMEVRLAVEESADEEESRESYCDRYCEGLDSRCACHALDSY